ncbi:MAG: hypothetical protein ACJ8R9_17130 [Steroidobacteraceae bacterium]
MISYSNAKSNASLNSVIPVALAALESMIRTEELPTRPRRPVEYEKETAALAPIEHGAVECLFKPFTETALCEALGAAALETTRRCSTDNDR